MKSENRSYSSAVVRFIASFIIVAALLVFSNTGCNSHKQHAHHRGSTPTVNGDYSGCDKSPTVLFGKDNKVLVRYSPSNKDTSYTIPDTVTHIARGAFMECKRLKNVTIGKGVTSIGEAAFSECSNLASIVIPESVTSIGEQAFMGCSRLARITIGNGVNSIGEQAFMECNQLAHVTLGSSVNSIGSWAFYGCGSLKAVYFKGNAPKLPEENAFYDPSVIHYKPGTTGWTNPWDGRPTKEWVE
jgi:hypothetical protein